MNDTDRPTDAATLRNIGKIETGGPYVYICRNGHDRVTFPDMGEMDWLDGEKFMRDLSTLPESEWMKKWLEPEDFQRFLDEKLKMKELVPVIREVAQHYTDIFGSSGEDNTSRTS